MNWEGTGLSVVGRWHFWRDVQRPLFITVAYWDPLSPSTGVICNEGIFETFPLGSFSHTLMWQRKWTALIEAEFNWRLLTPQIWDTIGQCGKRHINPPRRLVRRKVAGFSGITLGGRGGMLFHAVLLSLAMVQICGGSLILYSLCILAAANYRLHRISKCRETNNLHGSLLRSQHTLQSTKWKWFSPVRLFATPWPIQSWNSPGQNTGVGRLTLLQGIFWTQELSQGLLHCRQILYQLNYQGSP